MGYDNAIHLALVVLFHGTLYLLHHALLNVLVCLKVILFILLVGLVFYRVLSQTTH